MFIDGAHSYGYVLLSSHGRCTAMFLHGQSIGMNQSHTVGGASVDFAVCSDSIAITSEGVTEFLRGCIRIESTEILDETLVLEEAS